MAMSVLIRFRFNAFVYEKTAFGGMLSRSSDLQSQLWQRASSGSYRRK